MAVRRGDGGPVGRPGLVQPLGEVQGSASSSRGVRGFVEGQGALPGVRWLALASGRPRLVEGRLGPNVRQGTERPRRSSLCHARGVLWHARRVGQAIHEIRRAAISTKCVAGPRSGGTGEPAGHLDEARRGWGGGWGRGEAAVGDQEARTERNCAAASRPAGRPPGVRVVRVADRGRYGRANARVS